ncbi:MAG: glycoside hydrolase family 3 C-terminal domain-containing protein [Lachnospiraceae bacterium]|nr:glycoside hydrolase family 3 C-terminal domain-containing protein [Lachnospiraceae bacterium]
MTEQQLQQILDSLTMDEKIGMVHGASLFTTAPVPDKDIPAFVFSDGPMGVRQEFEASRWYPIAGNDDYVSYLPCNSALAATFNRERAYETGQVLGLESRGRSKDMILAPGINILRSPLCGRNFEYMSEDPRLTGDIVVPFVKGVQESDTSACLKHFVLNNQETKRYFYNASVSDRALWEIYLPAFRAAIKGGCLGLMGSYNCYHGVSLCENREILTELLREEWKFDGMVVSDWGGVHDTVKAGNSGIDVDMRVTNDFDDYPMANPLKEAIRRGDVPEEALNEKVLHILNVMNRLHMLDGKRQSGHINLASSRQKLLQTAEESIVLLKNEGSALPLNGKKLKKLLLIGDNADRAHALGGGSAEIKALYELTPMMGLKMLLGGNCEIVYEPGYYNVVKGNAWEEETAQNDFAALGFGDAIAPRQDRKVNDEDIPALNAKYREDALKACKDADAVIFIGGLNHDHDVEDRDRADYHLPYDQDSLINDILDVRPDAIITLIAGSPVSTESWIDKAKAVVFSYYTGMEGGLALAEVLLGQICPSGKLPATFPKEISDSPAHKLADFPALLGEDLVAEYKEDVFVGYRYFTTENIEPRFAFGHGLSYAEFAYENLQVAPATDIGSDIPVAPGSDKLMPLQELPAIFTVSCDIRNLSDMAAKEIVQLYISPLDNPADDSTPVGVRRPAMELRGFDKKEIAAKDSASYRFELTPLDFSLYDEESRCYVAPEGDYEIRIGAASDDIRLTAVVRLDADYRISRS